MGGEQTKKTGKMFGKDKIRKREVFEYLMF